MTGYAIPQNITILNSPTIDNPGTVADSIFAVINQAYCYMSHALSGSKSKASIELPFNDFVGYLNYVNSIEGKNNLLDSNNIVNPNKFFIASNYPNPFNPVTTIVFNIPETGQVSLSIYNVKGQKVKEILNEELTKGQHQILWDGKNNLNKNVGSGIYFAKVIIMENHRLEKCSY